MFDKEMFPGEGKLLEALRQKAQTAKYELNEERWQVVKKNMEDLSAFFLENDPDAEFEFVILPEFAESCGMIVKTIDVFTKNMPRFCKLIGAADNMGISVFNNKVMLDFTFLGIARGA